MEGSLTTRFDEFVNKTRNARLKSIRDREYYDHKQLSEEERNILRSRGQPPVVINRIQPKINYLIGALPRTDPKAIPRTPTHSSDSEAATDALRYVSDQNNLDDISSEVFRNVCIEGCGAAITEFDSDKELITIRQIEWDRFYYDPHSRKCNFSDAKYMGIAVWKDLEDIALEYDVKKDDIDTALQDYYDEQFKDQPDEAMWCDKSRNRAMVCEEYYKKDGEWRYRHFMVGMLFFDEESPYLDEDGIPCNPISAESAYVDRHGNRYGVTRAYIDVQDEINKRRSKALHYLNTNQTMAEEGAVKNVNEFKREKAKPDGHMEVNSGALRDQKIITISTQAELQSHLLMEQEAKQEIDSVGVNAAMSGDVGSSTSGRAIQARQQGGITELGPIFSQHTSWKRSIHRSVWNRVRQFWTSEKWIRVTDDDKGVKFAALNQPVTPRMQLEEHIQATGEVVPPEILAQFEQDPRFDQVVEVRNQVSELDVDIVIEETPDVANIQQEEFNKLAELFPYSRGEISIYDLIEVSSLRSKKLILDRRDNPQQAEQANAIQQLETAERTANIELTNAQKTKTLVDAAAKEVETVGQSIENQLLQDPNVLSRAKVTASLNA